MCSISAVCEAGRRGTCGAGRLLAGLVHFTVGVILLRDIRTLGRGRWLGTAAVFGWQSGCKHCEARRFALVILIQSSFCIRNGNLRNLAGVKLVVLKHDITLGALVVDAGETLHVK